MEAFKDPILEYNPDAFEAVLAKYDLDGPGRLDEAVKILEDWIKMQPHFKKKNFNRRFLEATILSRKGSLERAKMLLDKYCTMRTLTPQYFGKIDVSRDIGNSKNKLTAVLLPKQTKDHYRVYLQKFLTPTFEAADMVNFFKYNVVLAEYYKMHECGDGMIAILDMSELNLVDALAKFDVMGGKQITDIQTEGFGTRLINHHIISDSKLVGGVIAIVKQVVSAKIGSRMIVHKSPTDLFAYIDKKILPKDYGGEEKSIVELRDMWIETLSSKEHMRHLEEMTEASTDESFRSSDKFSEEYAGMAGTFRVLKVD